MAFTDNNYSASMQDVFALRLEMMNQIKALQDAIAAGSGGGGTLCVNFTVGTPVEDEYNIDYPYTGDKTYGEILSAVQSGEALVAVFGFNVEEFWAERLQYPMSFVQYDESTGNFGDMRLVMLGDDPYSYMIVYGDPAENSSDYPAFIISLAK